MITQPKKIKLLSLVLNERIVSIVDMSRLNKLRFFTKNSEDENDIDLDFLCRLIKKWSKDNNWEIATGYDEDESDEAMRYWSQAKRKNPQDQPVTYFGKSESEVLMKAAEFVAKENGLI